jgi:alkanesulfonate monooxygenase SsuD/methylene tetrahydromethanopterin reductase-like flavin-dependent oxidoreductase (luciferase family)
MKYTLSDGRFVLGLGASTPQIVEGLYDTPYQAPYKRIRQVLRQLRALFQAERVPLSNVSDVYPLRLNVPSFEAPPHRLL